MTCGQQTMMPKRSFQLRKMLVATDFSEHSGAALRQALNLADRAGAEVTLAHVITNPAWAVEGTSFEAHWRVPRAEIKRLERKLRQQADERLAEALAPFRSAARKPRAETLIGVPFVEIIRAVQTKAYDLVVVGTRGLSKVKRFLVGSNAERLVRKCPCPVWVVKASNEGPPRSILVPLDFSEEVSGKSLKLAARLTDLFQCSLCLMHILNAADEIAQRPGDPATLDLRLQRRELRRAATRHLRDFAAGHLPSGTGFEVQVTIGVPWQKIGVVSRRLDTDLIVMGSLGRTGIPGFLIGNTAEKVLRHGGPSIIAVKPDRFVSPV
jgi:nucleotide-binding universal stress UspA family protein